ncbi:hypothetical protein MtrunA17_Chr1g0200591 [Medicago truncatula]|uniref:Transmembrane protein n=1 Tax=Medicago truncatula TaxID=3880 RepID=A0A396JTC0_MEDTR|nr:hypothetical protein MtrunA17_Chr1g0200591 [Medicago truncatula]
MCWFLVCRHTVSLLFLGRGPAVVGLLARLVVRWEYATFMIVYFSLIAWCLVWFWVLSWCFLCVTFFRRHLCLKVVFEGVFVRVSVLYRNRFPLLSFFFLFTLAY